MVGIEAWKIGFGTVAAVVDGGEAHSAVGVDLAVVAGVLGEEGPVEAGESLQLTVDERERISQAVRAAEQHTNAEIVPMVVTRSGLYREVQHRAGLVLAVIALAVLVSFEMFVLPWGWHTSNAAWLILAAILTYGVGSWLGGLAPVVRVLASTERMQHKVRLRAERAFAQHALSHTRERTGVLLMVSLLEHQIYVLPDQPLFQRVPQERWSQVAQAVVGRLRGGDVVGGLCQGIETCGLLLAEICPGRPDDNPNELSNELIQE